MFGHWLAKTHYKRVYLCTRMENTFIRCIFRVPVTLFVCLLNFHYLLLQKDAFCLTNNKCNAFKMQTNTLFKDGNKCTIAIAISITKAIITKKRRLTLGLIFFLLLSCNKLVTIKDDSCFAVSEIK